MIVAL